MQLEQTALEGVLVLTPQRFGDARGWFSETWNEASARDLGLNLLFCQDNHSFSAAKGTLRGLHYQRPPMAQDKLVRCTRGAIFDVAVDVRAGSSRFGAWVGVELTPENGKQLLVPKGFLHGFLTLTEDTEVQYKCTNPYAPDCDGAVAWDSVGIDWPFPPASLSAKDAAAPAFADWQTPFTAEARL